VLDAVVVADDPGGDDVALAGDDFDIEIS